ncbi:MAG: hypothetical protein JNM27_07950 [Leptospirales bacterium]|nr:hypothetical protein [Leptospirales bacterium]
MWSAAQTEKLKAVLDPKGQPVRTRIAPTPSGFLHIGNAFSFIFTWLIARERGGTVLLRIDDLDHQRKRAEYVQDIFDSLEWLGLDWDSGPAGPDDFERRFSQVHRMDLYLEALEQLRLSGRLFACSCSRSARKEGLPHKCDCRAKQNSFQGLDQTWRFHIEDDCVVRVTETGKPITVHLGETQGSFVVRKRDGSPAYQIASIVDDNHFEIDLIVRGVDLLESSAMQLKIQDALDLSRTFQFLHHDLITDPLGAKLSKSSGATALKTLRNAQDASHVFREFSEWIGLAGRPCENLGQAQERFHESFYP